MRFKEFILNEKIQLNETPFGNKQPFDNSQFSNIEDEIFTYFKHENELIHVSYEFNSFNFGIIENGILYRSKTESSLKFFKMQNFYGKLLYVFDCMVKKFDIKNFIVYSIPSEPKLVKIYDFFSKNSNIKSILSSMGFKYYEMKEVNENGNKITIHSFSKIKDKIIQPKITKK